MFDVLAKNINESAVKNQGAEVLRVPEEVGNLQSSDFDIVPFFPDMDDDVLESENVLKMIKKIEKENVNLVPEQAKQL